MRVSLAFMAWDKLTRSYGMWWYDGSDVPESPPVAVTNEGFPYKNCNAILVVTGILVMGISNIYIQIYIPFVTKLL